MEHNNKNSVFREKSLERVSSPEQLDSYIKAVNPAAWVILCAIAVLLVGAIIWGSVIKLETRKLAAAAVVKNGELSLYLAGEDRDEVSEGMTLHIGELDFELPEVELNAVKLFEQTDSAVIDIIGDTESEYAYKAKMYIDLPNGIYNAEIVSQEISPMSLLFN